METKNQGLLEVDRNLLFFIFKQYLPHHWKLLANVCKYFNELIKILKKQRKEEKEKMKKKERKIEKERRNFEHKLLEITKEQEYEQIMDLFSC